jgi:hypothetical protein
MNHAKEFLLARLKHIVEITKDDKLSHEDKVKSVSAYARGVISYSRKIT